MSRTQKTSETRQPVARWKWLVSVLLIGHLLAVVAEPFRFFTSSWRGTSPLSDVPRNALAPYIEFAYLHHGYFFFAPEPGSSHLMDCRLTLQDGKQVAVMIPDKKKQWPRLLYHRHFMLSEFLHQLHEVQAFDVFAQVRTSMCDHMVAKYNAKSVEIGRVEHILPGQDEYFRQRTPLDSPTLYVTLPDVVLEPNFSPPGNRPPPLRPALPGLRGPLVSESGASNFEEIKP